MAKVRESFLPPLWVLTSVALVAAVWLTVQLKELLVLVVVGYFIAYAIDPLLHRLERRGIHRGIGIWVLLGLFVAAVGIFAVTTIPTVVAEYHKLMENLSRYVQVGREKLGPYLDQLREMLPADIAQIPESSEVLSSISSLASNVSGDTVKNVLRAVGGTLLRGYSLTLTIVNIALLPFIVYYLAVDMPHIHSFCARMVPITKRRKFESLFGEIDAYVSAFVRGQALVCCILFVLYAVGLGALRVDLWLLLAAISGFGNIIPYVGFLSGIILSSLMALVTYGDFIHVAYVWGVYGAVQALEGTLITPRILGDSVGLSPLVIILALFAGGQLFGLLGVFLAVPAAAALRVIVRHAYEWALDR
jgi:predicted PurR-regulated permease PerM